MPDFSSKVNDFQANSEVSPSLRRKIKTSGHGFSLPLDFRFKIKRVSDYVGHALSQFSSDNAYSPSGNGSGASRTRRRPSPGLPLRSNSGGCAAFSATCGVASPLACAIAPWQSQMGSVFAHRSGENSSKSSRQTACGGTSQKMAVLNGTEIGKICRRPIIGHRIVPVGTHRRGVRVRRAHRLRRTVRRTVPTTNAGMPLDFEKPPHFRAIHGSPRIRISHPRHPRFRTMNLSSISLQWASALPVSNSRQRLKTDHKAERCWMPGSLSDLSRPAAEIGDSARISPRFRHLCSHKLLKLLTRTSIPSLKRSKSDRLLVRNDQTFGPGKSSLIRIKGQ